MSEKLTRSEDRNKESTTSINRRKYLKLASMAGTGLGTGLGASALGNEFTTPARAATAVVDDFGNTNLSGRYVFDQRGATTSVSTVSSAVTSGADTNVLQMDGGGDTRMHAYKGDGDTDLNAYPENGDTFSCWMRGLNGTENMNFIYGAQDKDNKYYVKLNLETGALGLFKYVSGSGQSLQGDWSNSSIQSNTGWFELEINWATDHTHTVTLYQNGSQVTSFSYTEGSTDPQFTSTGVGYSVYLSSGETAQFDYATTTGGSNSGGSTSVYKQSNVDNFEVADKKLDAYRFDRGESGTAIIADSDTTGTQVGGPTYSGTRALQIKDSSATEMISLPGDGLEDYPEAGDTFKCYVKAMGGADNFNLSWGVQGHSDRYYVKVKPSSGSMYLFKYKNNDGTVLDSTSGLSVSQDTWYYIEVVWNTDGTQTVELYDLDGNELGKCSGVDTEWSTGGVGFDAYLGSGEAVHFDDYVIVEQEGEFTGGWGPNHVWRYNSESTGDPDWNKIEDFHYFLNYSGAKKEIDSDGNLDKIVHEFMISGFGQTFKKHSDFQYDPLQKELDVATGIDANKIVIDVDTTNQSPGIRVPDNKTWTAGFTGPQWSNWKNTDSNWDTEVGFNQFKKRAIDESVLAKDDSDYMGKALYFAFNTWVAMSFSTGVGVGLSALKLLADAAYDPPSNCEPTDDPATDYHEVIGWDYCDPMSLTVHHRFLELELEPNQGDVNVAIEQEFQSIPNETFQADNICRWELTLPDSAESATWSSTTRQGDI